MFTHRILTKAEQDAENIKDRRAWENHVIAIFNGFLASFIILTALLSALGVWLMRFMHI